MQRLIPRVETLEDRWTPACDVYTSADGAYLYIIGDDTANTVQIDQNDNDNTIKVHCDGDAPYTTDSSPVNFIYVDLKGGNDTIYWRQKSSFVGWDKNATIKLGQGSLNSAIIDFGGPTGTADMHGYWQINVEGGSGNDDVYASFGQKYGGRLDFTANLGDGLDDADVNIQKVHAAALVRVELNGGNHRDTLTAWIGYLDIWTTDISFDSRVEVRMNGNAGNDLIDFDYAGKLAGELYVRLYGSGDQDEIQSDLRIDAASNGELDIRAYGGSGDDYLYMSLKKNGADIDIVKALLDGGAGTDSWHRFKTTGNVQVKNCEIKVPLLGPVGP